MNRGKRQCVDKTTRTQVIHIGVRTEDRGKQKLAQAKAATEAA